MPASYLKNHLEKLHAFSVVGRVGSIARAANELHMSQAALSQAIKVLETALDVQLLLRRPRGVELTQAGRTLFEYSKRLLLDIETVEANVLSKKEEKISKIRVGTHETLAIHLWPNFLDKFSTKHPDISVSVMSGRIDDLVHGLLNREFHLIVTVEPVPNPKLKIEELYRNYLGFFVGRKEICSRYPVLMKKRITITEANEVPMFTDVCAHIEQQMSIPLFLVKKGLSLKSLFELNSFEAAIQFAIKGLGIAVLPERNGREMVKSGHLREIKILGIPSSSNTYRLCVSYLNEANSDSGTQLLANELKKML